MKSRAFPPLLVFLSVSLTLALCGAVSYRAGQRTAPLIRFLDPRLTPTVDEAFLSFPIEYALRSSEPNDVIFLGDSSCRHNIDPAKLPGIRSYNLGMVGSAGSLGMFLTTTAYLNHHPKPKLIFICIAPVRLETAQGNGGHVVRRFFANYGPEVPGVFSPLDGMSYFVRRGALAIAGQEDTGPRIVDGPLRGMESETFLSLQDRLTAHRGFFALPGERGVTWALDRPPKMFILPEWMEGIQRLAKLCRSAGVPLAIRFGPLWDGASKSRDFAQLETWADSLEASTPGVTVARPTLTVFDRSIMWDVTHLNEQGRERFMPIIMNDVRKTIAE